MAWRINSRRSSDFSVIAAPLAAQNYVQSNEPADTDLLIVVYWGTTIVPNDVMPLGTRASDMM
ncbi:MAG: hypothetical protein ABSF76_13235, partial [Opitutaceae bacterium]